MIPPFVEEEEVECVGTVVRQQCLLLLAWFAGLEDKVAFAAPPGIGASAKPSPPASRQLGAGGDDRSPGNLA
jgi:hypothetical protein